MIAGFHHVALRVRDVDRVSNFYVQLLGLVEVKRHVYADGQLRSVWIAAHSGEGPQVPFLAIERCEARPANGTLGAQMVAFAIHPELRGKLVARLEAAGVAVEKQTAWTVYVRDPESNLVGFSHYPAGA